MKSKIELTQKVSETNYYSNSADADRKYDVSAKATVGNSTPHFDNGIVKVKDGDVAVATFSKSQYGGLNINFADGGIPTTDATIAVVTDICAFIDALKDLSE